MQPALVIFEVMVVWEIPVQCTASDRKTPTIPERLALYKACAVRISVVGYKPFDILCSYTDC